jgi:ribosomal protein L11 methyltransferase
MKEFETLRYRVQLAELNEVVIAFLAEVGFDGFLEENEGWITASRLVGGEQYRPLQECIDELPCALEWSSEWVAEQNWNLIWEQQFPMVEIGEHIRIRAPFHPIGTDAREEFVIEPDMAFGTGHHPTTHLMAEALRERSTGKICLDFGTGTGILAMVMLRFGANNVVGIDNDERAIRSALRHILQESNAAERAQVYCSSELPEGPFDLIAANIHLNIIVEKLPEMHRILSSGGWVLASGILENQVKTVEDAAHKSGFLCTFKQIKEGWACLGFEKLD